MFNPTTPSKRKCDGSPSRTAVNRSTNDLIEFLRSEHQIDEEISDFLRDKAISGKKLLLLGSSTKEYLNAGLRLGPAVELAHIVKSLDQGLVKESKSGLSILRLPSLKLTLW
jgi:hypothetical protein